MESEKVLTGVNAAILGIGTYAPEKVLTNLELEKIVDTSDEWIKTRTGISERRIASSDEAASDLGYIAGKRALEDAGINPEEIELIIVATNTPDMLFPATACLIQERLGAKNAAAFDLGAGCTGFIYAVTVGSQFIKTGMYKTVLVIGTETLSKVTNWEDRSTCVLLADGAGAVVLGPVPTDQGILSCYLCADGDKGPLLLMPAGGSRRPATIDTVENNLHKLYMKGNEIYKLAIKFIMKSTEKVLADAGLDMSSLDFLIPHQANMRIIESSAKKLGLPMDKVITNIDRYGNTSTASIPLALNEALVEGKIKAGSVLVLVGFGSGLTWGAIALKWYDYKKTKDKESA